MTMVGLVGPGPFYLVDKRQIRAVQRLPTVPQSAVAWPRRDCRCVAGDQPMTTFYHSALGGMLRCADLGITSTVYNKPYYTTM
jgi:hypothetical protein